MIWEKLTPSIANGGPLLLHIALRYIAIANNKGNEIMCQLAYTILSSCSIMSNYITGGFGCINEIQA